MSARHTIIWDILEALDEARTRRVAHLLVSSDTVGVDARLVASDHRNVTPRDCSSTVSTRLLNGQTYITRFGDGTSICQTLGRLGVQVWGLLPRYQWQQRIKRLVLSLRRSCMTTGKRIDPDALVYKWLGSSGFHRSSSALRDTAFAYILAGLSGGC